jgi:ABC-type antimicrobial peptide transport system permease subunit
LGIPVLAGREFTDRDIAGSVRVAIVNEALARQFWSSRFPVGDAFFLDGNRYLIVGVVRNTKIWSLTDEAQPFLYLPVYQSYTASVAVHVKSKHPAGWVHRLVEHEIEQRDPLLPVVSGQAMTQQVDVALFPQRIAMVMLGIFSALGVYLAAIGLYGVIAHSARSRTKEIAIRMAVGASVGQIRWLVTRQAASLVGLGSCAGAAITIVMNHFLKSVLIGINGIEFMSITATAALIALVALGATWIPMLRATRVNAASALRAD